MAKRPKPKPPAKRNFAAFAATNQKAGPIKDRRSARGGAKNTMREDLSQRDQG